MESTSSKSEWFAHDASQGGNSNDRFDTPVARDVAIKRWIDLPKS